MRAEGLLTLFAQAEQRDSGRKGSRCTKSNPGFAATVLAQRQAVSTRCKVQDGRVGERRAPKRGMPCQRHAGWTGKLRCPTVLGPTLPAQHTARSI